MNRRRSPLRTCVVWFVAIATLAAACGADDVVATSAQPTADVAATPSGLLLCEDVASLGSAKVGLLGGRSNPDHLLMGVLQTYAQEHADTFAGLWIDRDSDGVIVVAFTDDPEPHVAELLNRGPTETDVVGIQPPLPITDPSTLAERDDFVFDVIQVTHTEVALRAAQSSANSLSGVEGTGASGLGIDTSKNIVSLNLVDPTDEGLDVVIQEIDDMPICVSIFRSPEPPSGPLDVIPTTGEPLVMPDGLGEVRWELDPAFAPPGADDTELHVLATELECASGRDMGDALRGPQVIETSTEVIIAFAVEVEFSGGDCQGNPPTPAVITLAAPLGNRTLRNGADSRSQPVVNEVEVPTVDQPDSGDGWRMVSSSHFIDVWNGPVAATTVEEFWLLSDTFWDVGLDAADVDFDSEILIAQTVIKQLGDDQRCGPHVMDNVRIEDGVFLYDLSSPLHSDDEPCADPDAYQVFVVALARDRLPDAIRIPNRSALIEIQIR